MKSRCIDLEIQGGIIRRFTDLVLDYTGTLSLDGTLLPGVAERLIGIASGLRITIMTADTFGMAAEQTKGLPVDFRIIRIGIEKADAVSMMGGENVIAVGNGRNDVPMMSRAGLSIAVIGPEGVSAELIHASDIVVRDICDALDLIIHPLRLKATLRD
ncbi:MAG: HAD hydrolase family protein [Pseudomonadota bacterium]|nr:HAD hydrolase family protein [Pseudomonadota bacterium]MBU1398887.1 HAD hydrolase family protein [Pseudomonadota bacterium]MBU1571019.1 HAD hydrolase family protein [Pseudomonadota bacterium]